MSEQKIEPKEQQQVIAPEKFDLKTHHRNNKGRLLKENPYRLHVVKGMRLFERPVGSGNCFHENGEEAGRMLYDISDSGVKSKKHNPTAEHVAWTPPLSGAEKDAVEREKLRKENEELRKELEAIRGERQGEPASREAQPPQETAAPLKPPETNAPVAGKDAQATKKPEGSVENADEKKDEDAGKGQNFKDLVK